MLIENPRYAGIIALLAGNRAEKDCGFNAPGAWNTLVDAAVRDGVAGLALEALRASAASPFQNRDRFPAGPPSLPPYEGGIEGGHDENSKPQTMRTPTHANGVEPPAFVVPRLRASARMVAVRNEQMIAAIEPLAQALHDAGIEVMLLKGAALNLCCYPAYDLRPMSDVDLLVRERDARRAIDVLIGAGCRAGMSLLREDYFPRFYYETELLTTGAEPMRIDLHARPLRPLRYRGLIDEQTFWRDAPSVRIGTARVLVPAPETMLIHLAAHAAFHGCDRLIWLYDLVRWTRVYGSVIDWDRFEKLCAVWRLSLPVRCAIEQAERCFGEIVPASTRRTLAKEAVDWRDRLTLWQAPRDAGSPWLHVMVELLCTSGARLRWAYLWAHLRPGRAHLAEGYPYRHAGWPAAAAVYRLLRAAVRLVVGVVRRLPLIGRSGRTGVDRTSSSDAQGPMNKTPVAAHGAGGSLCPGM